MIPLDDVGIIPQRTPDPHTCYPRQSPKQHCDPCNVDGLLIRYSQALRIGLGDGSLFDVVMRSAQTRVACYCGCGGSGG